MSAIIKGMEGTLLPLFPLSLVLLTTTELPLHIFEERYKEMMSELIPTRGEFGVVRMQDEGIVNIGCTATVEDVLQRHPDGQLDLIATGRRRFQIAALNEEKSYLRAEVEFFNDEDASEVPETLRSEALRQYAQLQSLSDRKTPPRLQEPQLSFQLGDLIDDLDHRQALLAIRSESQRLVFLLQHLPAYLARKEQVELAKKLAPRNGHAKNYQKR